MAKEVKFDAEGTEAVTNALLDLVNTYPGLEPGEAFHFATLGDDRGRAFFPSTGAVIDEETRDILGNVHQVCVYPFALVTRAKGLTEPRRAAIKEWLDKLGRWLNRQPVAIKGIDYTLESYPALTGGRILQELKLTVPAHLDGIGENGAEDWVCQVEARYTNDFKRRLTPWKI